MNSEPTPPQQPDTEAPEEQPEVYAIRKHGSRWDVTRRHVVTGSALAAATSLVGCSDTSPSSSPSPNYSASLLPPIAHTEDILVIKATPNGDLLLSGGQDKTVKFWSLPKGHLVRSLMGHQHPITHIAISPNGALAATADSGPKIILWSIPEGRRQRQLKSVTLAPNDLCISDQGEVAIRKNLTLMFWPTAETELEPQQRTLPASPTVHLFAPHTSGLWSVAACQSNTLYLTNLTQSSLVHTLTGISCSQLAASPDGELLAVLDLSHVLRIIKLASGQPVTSLKLDLTLLKKGSLTANIPVVIHHFQFRDSTSFELLIQQGNLYELRVYRINPVFKLVHDIAAHQDVIHDFVVSVNSKYAATASRDRSVKIWKITDWSLERELTNLPAACFSLCFQDHDRVLILGGGDGNIQVCSLSNPKQPLAEPQPAHQQGVTRILADNKLTWTCGRDEHVKVWELQTSEIYENSLLNEVGKFHGGSSRLYCLAITDRWIATGSLEGTIRLWDRQSKAIKELVGHEGIVHALAITHDGKTLISAGADGLVLRWSIDSGTEIDRVMQHDGDVFTVTINDDKQWVASGGKDGMIRISPTSHHGHLGSVDASTSLLDLVLLNDQQIAGTGQDGHIRVWEIPNIQEESREKVILNEENNKRDVIVIVSHKIYIRYWSKNIRIHSLTTGEQQVMFKDLVMMNYLETERINRQKLEEAERRRREESRSSYSSPSESYGHYWRPN